MADITLEEMLQAGVHFGHQTKYWNPKMEQHIFGVRDKIHIINLEHTVEMIKPAMKFIESVAAKNNKILFVGTKRTATDIIKNMTLTATSRKRRVQRPSAIFALNVSLVLSVCKQTLWFCSEMAKFLLESARMVIKCSQ